MMSVGVLGAAVPAELLGGASAGRLVGAWSAVVVSALCAYRGQRRDDLLARLGDRPRRSAVPDWFASALAWVEPGADAAAAWPAAVCLAAVALVAVAVWSPAAFVALLVLGLLVSVFVGLGRRRSEVARIDAVELVEALLAPLGSGATLDQAVRRAASVGSGPVATALAGVEASIVAGSGVLEALEGWARRVGDDSVMLVVDALAVAAGSGGSRISALLAVGDTLREREALAREVQALASQARASATVLAVTPPAFTAFVAVVDERVSDFIFGSVAGWGCLGLGVLLDAIGWSWMKRLTGRVS